MAGECSIWAMLRPVNTADAPDGEGGFWAAALAAAWVRSKLIGALGKIRPMESLEYPRNDD